MFKHFIFSALLCVGITVQAAEVINVAAYQAPADIAERVQEFLSTTQIDLAHDDADQISTKVSEKNENVPLYFNSQSSHEINLNGCTVKWLELGRGMVAARTDSLYAYRWDAEPFGYKVVVYHQEGTQKSKAGSLLAADIELYQQFADLAQSKSFSYLQVPALFLVQRPSRPAILSEENYVLLHEELSSSRSRNERQEALTAQHAQQLIELFKLAGERSVTLEWELLDDGKIGITGIEKLPALDWFSLGESFNSDENLKESIEEIMSGENGLNQKLKGFSSTLYLLEKRDLQKIAYWTWLSIRIAKIYGLKKEFEGNPEALALIEASFLEPLQQVVAFINELPAQKVQKVVENRCKKLFSSRELKQFMKKIKAATERVITVDDMKLMQD